MPSSQIREKDVLPLKIDLLELKITIENYSSCSKILDFGAIPQSKIWEKEISQAKNRAFGEKATKWNKRKTMFYRPKSDYFLGRKSFTYQIREFGAMPQSEFWEKEISHARNWAFGDNATKQNGKKDVLPVIISVFELEIKFDRQKPRIWSNITKEKMKKMSFHWLKNKLLELMPLNEIGRKSTLSWIKSAYLSWKTCFTN